MVCTLIDHRNDVIKCSKLKWNQEPQASGFTAKFWTFYGVISMVYKSVEHGKLWSICFFTMTFIFSFLRSFSGNHARSDVFLVVIRIFATLFSYTFGTSSTNSLSEISLHMLKLGSSLTMLRSKIIFTKNQKQNNRHCLT